ncbi:MAG: hypothetical protein OCD02_17665 [Spirochaetaceae bacterium]
MEVKKLDLKNELKAVENAFCKKAKEIGIDKAFLLFIADNGVINRDSKIYKGQDGLLQYFTNATTDNIDLIWTPDYVDVATSGDIGYTYGSYTMHENNIEITKGQYCTIWKRQEDGSWKFVYD